MFLEQLLSFKADFSTKIPEYLILIFFVFSILSLSINIFSSSIYSFFKTVSKGNIEPLLVKPTSIYETIFLKHTKPLNIVLIILISTFIFYTTKIFSIDVELMVWTKFALAIFCSFILNILFIFILNLLTFVTGRFLPIDYIHEEVYSLSIVPISLYPKGVLKYLIMILPIGISASFPVFILEKDNNFLLTLFISITLISLLITIYLFKKAFKNFNGLGG